MKLTVLLLLITLLRVNANSYAQITLVKKDAPLLKVFKDISRQSGYSFVYTQKSLKNARNVNVNLQHVSIEQALEACFADQPFTYEVMMKTVIVKPLPPQKAETLDIRVTGTVTDSKGDPLPGVSVKVKGESISTSTDALGRYTINAPENGTLVFSYIGFVSQDVALNGQTIINVSLQEAVTSLNQVVVTALGLERQKKTLTYSTQTVGAKELTQARELNVVNALQGKVAGLNISSGSTGVGASARVILRGNRSISGSSEPLYVIDGVPIRGNPVNLNPDNIASMNILKGANASALYGSSGQNGVIVIETKKGKEGVNIGLSTTYMFQDAIQSIPFQYQYGQGAAGVYNKSSEDSWGPALDGTLVPTWSLNPAKAGTTYPFVAQNNVREGIFQTGHNSATNLSITTGNEKTQTAFTYTYTDAAGIIPNNALQRHNLTGRMTNQLSKRLSIDSKLDYAIQNIDNRLDEGESSYNPVRHIYTMPPNIRKEDLEDFEFRDPSTGAMLQDYWANGVVTSANTYWSLYRNLRYDKSNRLIAMTSFSYLLGEDLKVMVRGSYDGESNENEEKSFNGTFRDPSGRYALGKGTAQQVAGDFLIGYNKKFNSVISLQANFGGEIRHTKTNTILSSTGTGMNVPNLFSLTNTLLPTAFSSMSAFETQSLYSNAVVGWKDALFLDVSARNDWNTTLPADNRSYFYPSAGVSAVLSELVKLPQAFSYLKLRGSLAQVGNGTQPYKHQRFVNGIAGGNLGYIILDPTLPNKNLKPEKTTSTELGMEMNMFNSRLGLDLTLYKTNTNNQLFSLALPVGSGAASYFTNGGDVQNKGIEAILNTTPVKASDFKWDLSFNYALNRSEVKEISKDLPRLVLGGDVYMREFVLEEGKPFGLIYGKGFQRDADGRVLVGANGLPQFTPGRTVLLGNINPNWTGGLSTTVSYKNWSASFLITHKQGGVVASYTDALLYGSGLVEETLQGRDGGLIFGQNVFSSIPAVKASDGSVNDLPVKAETFWKGMGARTAPVGEAFKRSATNTRLREINIGYRLPKSLFRNIPVSSVDVSLVGRNLLFLYRKDSNIDPDFLTGVGTVSEGYQSFAPPTTRSFGANLRVNF